MMLEELAAVKERAQQARSRLGKLKKDKEKDKEKAEAEAAPKSVAAKAVPAAAARAKQAEYPELTKRVQQARAKKKRGAGSKAAPSNGTGKEDKLPRRGKKKTLEHAQKGRATGVAVKANGGRLARVDGLTQFERDLIQIVCSAKDPVSIRELTDAVFGEGAFERSKSADSVDYQRQVRNGIRVPIQLGHIVRLHSIDASASRGFLVGPQTQKKSGRKRKKTDAACPA